MNEYQQEQWDALSQVRGAMARLNADSNREIQAAVAPYLNFRKRVDHFLDDHFGERCTQNCHQNRRSACCSRDGILMFWADVAINAVCSNTNQLDDLEAAIRQPTFRHKCIFLGEKGCRFKVRPLVCAMFLCEPLLNDVFSKAPAEDRQQWQSLENEAKQFRWPDHPVLFDWFEMRFIELGCRSSLMHINTTPGLMRIKKQNGLPIASWPDNGLNQRNAPL